MSSVVNKIKDTATPGHTNATRSSEPTGTHGTHNSRVANAADPRIDSDRDNRAAPHSHGLASGTTGAPTGTHGPHSGRVANAADPRVDSDRDGRAQHTTGLGGSHGYTAGDNYTTGTTGSHGLTGTHGTTGTHGVTGTHGTTGTHGATGTTSHNTTAGPHSSNLLNKADPRIDSDQSNARFGNTAGDYHGSGREGATGPHNSRVANAVDPRVDSDRDGSRTAGTTYGSSGTAGTTHTTGAHTTGTHTGAHTGAHTTGTHGAGATTTAHHTPGPAKNTAGPHKSDILNKLDPRVDSDLDGSKTVGGDKTYS